MGGELELFFLGSLLFCIVTVPLGGGQIRRLADIDLRHEWALYSAIGLQIIIITVLPAKTAFDVPAHIASYVFVGGFILANVRKPGVWLFALGCGMNAACIIANGGVMYGSPEAFSSAGVVQDLSRFQNSIILENPKLAFLGDIFAIPDGWPLTTVLSIGDLVIVVGAFVLVHGICGSKLSPSWAHGPYFKRFNLGPLTPPASSSIS